jgi:hypothetical protein
VVARGKTFVHWRELELLESVAIDVLHFEISYFWSGKRLLCLLVLDFVWYFDHVVEISDLLRRDRDSTLGKLLGI